MPEFSFKREDVEGKTWDSFLTVLIFAKPQVYKTIRESLQNATRWSKAKFDPAEAEMLYLSPEDPRVTDTPVNMNDKISAESAASLLECLMRGLSNVELDENDQNASDFLVWIIALLSEVSPMNPENPETTNQADATLNA